MKRTWIQDTEEERATTLLDKANRENLERSPMGSKYVTGLSKSGK